MRAIRYRMHGVLKQAGIIAHRQKMACLHGRRREVVWRDRVSFAARNDLTPVTLPRTLEGGHIALGSTLPCHRSAGRVGSLAHGLPAMIVGKQLRNFVADLRRITKGNQNTT